MTNYFNTGNHKIINLKKGTKPTDAVTLEQLGESHISSYENGKNVFEYIMKTQTELTTYFGIYGASLLVYNFTPHVINKAAYKLTIARKTDESVFKGRWDLNLFKLIQDNYCIVIIKLHALKFIFKINTTINSIVQY